MDILVINAYCLTVNSSANLCHLAYINGLVDAGHNVTVLSSDGNDYKKDPCMSIPKNTRNVYVKGLSYYQKLSIRKNKSDKVVTSSSFSRNKSIKQPLYLRLLQKTKNLGLKAYGVHGIYRTFVRKTNPLKFSDSFDYIISLSSPAASHLVAYNLLKKNHVSCKHWIQIWEDPWYGDIYGFQNEKNILKEEKRLLKHAEKVCYVSPLTLKNRQELFQDSAYKMYWQPLPYYYKNDTKSNTVFHSNYYGYFGDYVPESRDLEPFYKASIQCRISVNICGNPSGLFCSTEKINIYPRLSLDELLPLEDSTNVLVFLCNRQGGQIPGKIYQYSATNKIILFILDGTSEEKRVLKEYFERFNRYVFCENTVEDIMRAIKVIESGNLGEVINKPIEDFSPKETVERILSECE